MLFRVRKHSMWTASSVAILLLVLLMLPPPHVAGQVGIKAMLDCSSMAFSTEEDFITQGPEPLDGNPLISDGDLLSPNGTVCARNSELLQPFDVTRDMGLDAVDVLDVENYLVAFSTELDSPHGNFTAGDLLDTNGTAIPNVALTYEFEIGYDLGLDAIHFIGELESITDLLVEAKTRGRAFYVQNPRALGDSLRQFNVDIWFSTEGSAPSVEQPGFLDGDLLSARDGIIILKGADLLPVSVPAGLPTRGVDFGLDGFAARSRDPERARRASLFSTEILYWPPDGSVSFTDGDVLHYNDGVAFTNADLIAKFEPRTTELGLDALFLVPFGPPPECYAALTALGGTQAPVANLDPMDGMATLLWTTRHPFGNDVPFWGYLAPCVTRFRIVFRPDGDTSDGTPILPGTWVVGDPTAWNPMTLQCEGTMSRPAADAQGYFDAVEYQGLLQCDPLPLTNWHSPAAPDPDGLYEVRLDYQVGTTTYHGPWYRVQLDNTLPEINDLNLVVKAGTSGGTDSCPLYTTANMPLMLQGDFADAHFWRYRASIDGDLYPAHTYTLTHYYDSAPAAAHLDDTGTMPDNTLVNLHPVSVFDIVAAPADCCYSVDVRVWDRTIWGTFWGHRALVSAQIGTWVSDDIYFAFQP
jgi:hypothetical protein